MENSFHSRHCNLIIVVCWHLCPWICHISKTLVLCTCASECSWLSLCLLFTLFSYKFRPCLLLDCITCHLRFADLNLRSPVLSYIKVSRCSALCSVTITSNALQVSSYVFICHYIFWFTWVLLCPKFTTTCRNWCFKNKRAFLVYTCNATI
jgi:hypothetical protein